MVINILSSIDSNSLQDILEILDRGGCGVNYKDVWFVIIRELIYHSTVVEMFQQRLMKPKIFW